jgi:hypothetical protein
VMIEAIEKQAKPWLADSEKTRLVFWPWSSFRPLEQSVAVYQQPEKEFKWWNLKNLVCC